MKHCISLFASFVSMVGLLACGNESASSADSEVESSKQVGSMTDPRDGKVYKTITVGDQVWMAENLNYAVEDATNNVGAYCYDDDESNCDKYGRLYSLGDVEAFCPEGWHVPSIDEWKVLIERVDGREIAEHLAGYRYYYSRPRITPVIEYRGLDSVSYFMAYSVTSAIGSRDKGFVRIHEDETEINPTLIYEGVSIRCVQGEFPAIDRVHTGERFTKDAVKEGSYEDPRDHQIYKTLTFDGMTWMAEDLNYAEGSSGCARDCKEKGRLYQWDAAMKACPSGWHLTSAVDWGAALDMMNFWKYMGYRLIFDNPLITGSSGDVTYWSSHEVDDTHADIVRFDFDHSFVTVSGYGGKDLKFNVRCVLDR